MSAPAAERNRLEGREQEARPLGWLSSSQPVFLNVVPAEILVARWHSRHIGLAERPTEAPDLSTELHRQQKVHATGSPTKRRPQCCDERKTRGRDRPQRVG